MCGMNSHMKTTLIIPDDVIKTLKRRAVEMGSTLSRTVEETLRRGLDPRLGRRPKLKPLPTFECGKPLVDLTNREAIEEAIERDERVRR